MHITHLHTRTPRTPARTRHPHAHAYPDAPAHADTRPHPWTQAQTGAMTYPCPPRPTTWTPAPDEAPASGHPWAQDLTAAPDAPARLPRTSRLEPSEIRDRPRDRPRPSLRLMRPIRHRPAPPRPEPIEIIDNRLARDLDP